MDALLSWRPQFPILENTVYMISNSLGAMPVGVYDRMREYADTWATRGVRAWADGWMDMPVAVGNLVGEAISRLERDMGTTQDNDKTEANCCK